MPNTIRIEIKDGQVQVEATGFHGEGCAKKVKEILDYFNSRGIKTTTVSDVKKPEYYEVEEQHEVVRQ